MKTEKKLITTFRKYLRIYKWVFVSSWWLVLLWFSGSLFSSIYKISPSFFVTMTLLFAFVVITILFSLISFLIIRALENLLKRIENEPSLAIGELRETIWLKKLLILQFIQNIFMFALTPNKNIEQTCKDWQRITAETPTFDFKQIESIIDKFSNIYNWTSWVTVPLETIMPVIYLIILMAIVRIHKENQELKREIEQVI